MLVQAYAFAFSKPRKKIPAFISSYTVYRQNNVVLLPYINYHFTTAPLLHLTIYLTFWANINWDEYHACFLLYRANRAARNTKQAKLQNESVVHSRIRTHARHGPQNISIHIHPQQFEQPITLITRYRLQIRYNMVQ